MRFLDPANGIKRGACDPEGIMISDETLGVAEIGEILRLLPHRYPFLLIDRIIDIGAAPGRVEKAQIFCVNKKARFREHSQARRRQQSSPRRER